MTTIIFDQNGKILMTQSGNMGVTDADVITFDVPDGYRVTAVNPETKEVSIEEIPKTEIEKEMETIKAQQAATDSAVLGLMNMMLGM